MIVLRSILIKTNVMQHLKIKKHNLVLLLTIYGPKTDIFKMLTFFQTDPGTDLHCIMGTVLFTFMYDFFSE